MAFPAVPLVVPNHHAKAFRTIAPIVVSVNLRRITQAPANRIFADLLTSWHQSDNHYTIFTEISAHGVLAIFSPPVLYHRHRYLLALLEALGGSCSQSDFQSILFLFTEQLDQPPYEFVLSGKGLTSFTCHADLLKLCRKGLISSQGQEWQLSDTARCMMTAANQYLMAASAFHKQKLDGSISDLVNEALQAISEAAKLATDQDQPTFRLQQATAIALGHSKHPPGLATIGYEGRSLEGFLNTLLNHGVTMLCDVRRNPLSRKFGFSKKILASGCSAVGIDYKHMPELGIASSQRSHLADQADYDALFHHYRDQQLPSQVPSLTNIKQWINSGERVALTCYEADVNQCHRGCVAQALAADSCSSLIPQHL
jgi:hypothetical protein